MEQELLTLPEHMSSRPVFNGVHVTRSLLLRVCFVDRCLSFVFFLLTIVLSVLLRYTDSDYPFGIFKLFLQPETRGLMEPVLAVQLTWSTRLPSIIFNLLNWRNCHSSEIF